MSDEAYKTNPDSYHRIISMHPDKLPTDPNDPAVLMEIIKDLQTRLTNLESAKIDVQGGIVSNTKQLKDGLSFDFDPQTANSGAGAKPFTGYPWITSILNAVSKVYSVIFGAGTSSFAGAAQPIKQFEMVVADPANGAASSMQLVVGDPLPSFAEGLKFRYNGGIISFVWTGVRRFLNIFDNEADPTTGDQVIIGTNDNTFACPTVQLTPANGTALSIYNTLADGTHIEGATLAIRELDYAVSGSGAQFRLVGFKDNTGTNRTAYILCTPPV